MKNHKNSTFKIKECEHLVETALDIKFFIDKKLTYYYDCKKSVLQGMALKL